MPELTTIAERISNSCNRLDAYITAAEESPDDAETTLGILILDVSREIAELRREAETQRQRTETTSAR